MSAYPRPASLLVLAVVFLASILPTVPCRAEPVPQATTGILEQINNSFAAIFERVAPSVVIVRITRSPQPSLTRDMLRRFGFDFFLRDPNPGTQPNDQGKDDSDSGRTRPGQPDQNLQMPPMPQSEGSGIIFSPDGYILTNNHVIADASSISVRLKDGREFDAEIVGRDDKTDVAVLKIAASGLPAAELADSDAVRVGELACVIGAPYNLDYSFTVGVVSAIGRANLYQAEYENYIQTDASINPGNSGGPLLDIHGRVIGINTLINGVNRGLGFAIPINMAREVAAQLIEHGRVIRPWLGIRIQTLAEKPELRDSLDGIRDGVVVETIEPDTPAYHSSLLPADVVTAIDGIPVKTSQELQRQVLSKKIGQTITLKVWRAGKFLDIKITTGELPDNAPESNSETANEPADEDAGVPSAEHESERPYGLGVEDLTPELARRLDIELTPGVLVMEVESDSPADLAGIRPRDVITEVGKRKTPDVKAFREALASAETSRGILLFIDRGGEKTYAMLKAD